MQRVKYNRVKNLIKFPSPLISFTIHWLTSLISEDEENINQAKTKKTLKETKKRKTKEFWRDRGNTGNGRVESKKRNWHAEDEGKVGKLLGKNEISG